MSIRISRKVWLTSLLLLVVFLLTFGIIAQTNPIQEGNTFQLKQPHFVDVAHADSDAITDFPVDEVGIAAYFEAPSTIDLNDVRPIYRTIEVETADYIIGSIAVPNYASESEDVHIYVHVDGWVMGYYLAADPAAKIIDWSVYDGATIITKFDTVLTTVAAAIGTTLPPTTYYDFRYPNATNLMLIAEAQYGTGSDTFEINLPSNFTYYERSWSLSCRAAGYHPNAWYYLNDVETYFIDECSYGDWWNVHDLFTGVQLVPDTFHTIKIEAGTNDAAFGGLALVYMVP